MKRRNNDLNVKELAVIHDSVQLIELISYICKKTFQPLPMIRQYRGMVYILNK